MICLAALIIASALIWHAHSSRQAMLEMQDRQSSSQRHFQIKQQQHEVSFAKMQSDMFHKAQAEAGKSSANKAKKNKENSWEEIQAKAP